MQKNLIGIFFECKLLNIIRKNNQWSEVPRVTDTGLGVPSMYKNQGSFKQLFFFPKAVSSLSALKLTIFSGAKPR